MGDNFSKIPPGFWGKLDLPTLNTKEATERYYEQIQDRQKQENIKNNTQTIEQLEANLNALSDEKKKDLLNSLTKEATDGNN